MKADTKKAGIDMLNGSLLDKIIMFALPLAASSVLQQLFNSIDMAVVGNYAGKEALAAVGSNSSVISLVVTLFVGVSVGANYVIANYIGCKNRQGIKDAVATIASVSLVSGVLLLFLGIRLARPILEFIDTPTDVIDLSTLYLQLYFAGIPFIMVFNFGSAILRSMGDTKRPLYCLFVSGAINAVLNIILVVCFNMGVAGVGIATLVANAINAVLIVYILQHERNPFRLVFARITFHKKELTKMLQIGIPAGVQGLVFAIANVTIQSSINSFGSSAMSGSAAALNYEHFCYFIIAAFSSAAVTFMGQNIAAGKKERCRRIFFYTMWLCVVSCCFFNVLFTWQESFFIGIFNSDPEVHEFAYVRMEWVLLLQFVASSYEVSSGALRGLGYSSLPAALTVVGTCVLRLCWVYWFIPSHHVFKWLMVVYPISWVVTGVMVLLAYYVVCKRKNIY
ncbi:MAG: MATE family efflux transporter [Paludibacteraceae bacterium]|nr:MATE family efflux transporter [Paludibacteraceae bacterium]